MNLHYDEKGYNLKFKDLKESKTYKIKGKFNSYSILKGLLVDEVTSKFLEATVEDLFYMSFKEVHNVPMLEEDSYQILYHIRPKYTHIYRSNGHVYLVKELEKINTKRLSNVIDITDFITNDFDTIPENGVMYDIDKMITKYSKRHEI